MIPDLKICTYIAFLFSVSDLAIGDVVGGAAGGDPVVRGGEGAPGVPAHRDALGPNGVG